MGKDCSLFKVGVEPKAKVWGCTLKAKDILRVKDAYQRSEFDGLIHWPCQDIMQ